ncbi:ATP-dependent DNA helicase sgs1 [Mortierella alpina]|uniref:DNA 3'-5' helicase n=1 Tax=Mortierella alpina TaxID=64518 RepID=A0A9P6IVF5_MORAP|nr:ATP-dependent DNA helicase sgs1 [Mortierella alpina]
MKLKIRFIEAVLALTVCYSIDTMYEGLEFLLDFKKTIAYFDKLDELTKAFRHLARKARALEPRPDHQIGCYLADLTAEIKKTHMSKFQLGEIRVLLSTDAAGMGCDISDVLRVVQFRFPRDITVLAQRLGRAARNPSLQGSGILVYPRTDNRRLNTMDATLKDWVLWNNPL